MTGYTYPHMCRADHDEIGHRTDHEECPVCLMRNERDEAQAQCEAADRRWALAADECDRLRALLREFQWGGYLKVCLSCGRSPEEGHNAICRIAAPLEGR